MRTELEIGTETRLVGEQFVNIENYDEDSPIAEVILTTNKNAVSSISYYNYDTNYSAELSDGKVLIYDRNNNNIGKHEMSIDISFLDKNGTNLGTTTISGTFRVYYTSDPNSEFAITNESGWTIPETVTFGQGASETGFRLENSFSSGDWFYSFIDRDTVLEQTGLFFSTNVEYNNFIEAQRDTSKGTPGTYTVEVAIIGNDYDEWHVVAGSRTIEVVITE